LSVPAIFRFKVFDEPPQPRVIAKHPLNISHYDAKMLSAGGNLQVLVVREVDGDRTRVSAR
jgi:hypothetical protein